MKRLNPPTLKELLDGERLDTSEIEVSRHNYKKPAEPEVIYNGPVSKIPENVLNMEILAWIRSKGFFIAK